MGRSRIKSEEELWQRCYVGRKRRGWIGSSRLEVLQEQRYGGGNEAGLLRVQRREPLENRKSQGQRVWASLDVWLQHKEAIIFISDQGKSHHHHHITILSIFIKYLLFAKGSKHSTCIILCNFSSSLLGRSYYYPHFTYGN